MEIVDMLSPFYTTKKTPGMTPAQNCNNMYYTKCGLVTLVKIYTSISVASAERFLIMINIIRSKLSIKS